MKKVEQLARFLLKGKSPIVLVEGTRAVSQSEFDHLEKFGAFIASALPENCIFRSGNAPGSDEAFCKGVRKVAPDRLEIVLPIKNFGVKRLGRTDYTVALESLTRAEEEQAVYNAKVATPKNSRLLDAYLNQTGTLLDIKGRYLVRDVVKVIGSASNGLAPATVGIFFVNAHDPESGGTGHTMRVCRQHGVRVITQDVWWSWIGT